MACAALVQCEFIKCIHSGCPSIRTRQVGICIVTKCMDAEDNAIVFGLQKHSAPRTQTVLAQTAKYISLKQECLHFGCILNQLLYTAEEQ